MKKVSVTFWFNFASYNYQKVTDTFWFRSASKESP